MTKIQLLALLGMVLCFQLIKAQNEWNFEDDFEAREFQDSPDVAEEEVRGLLNEESNNEEEERSFEEENQERERNFEDSFVDAFQQELNERNFEEDIAEEQERNLEEEKAEEQERNFEEENAEEQERNFEEENAEKQERNFEDAFVEAFQQELKERSLQEENDEEKRDFEDLLAQELQEEEERQEISADFDLTRPRPKEESERQVTSVPVTTRPVVKPLPTQPPRPAPPDSYKGRSTRPLRLSDLIIRPVITRRCRVKGNQSIRSHCAKYLMCSNKKYRGAVRTCESGEAYDVRLQKCNKASLVDCTITD